MSDKTTKTEETLHETLSFDKQLALSQFHAIDGIKVNLHLIYKAMIFRTVMNYYGSDFSLDEFIEITNKISKDLDTSHIKPEEQLPFEE